MIDAGTFSLFLEDTPPQERQPSASQLHTFFTSASHAPP